MLRLLICAVGGASAQPMLPAGEAGPGRMQPQQNTWPGLSPAAARATDATAPGLAPRAGMVAGMGLGPGAGPIDPVETLHRTQALLNGDAGAREVHRPQAARTPRPSHAELHALVRPRRRSAMRRPRWRRIRRSSARSRR